MDRPTRPPWQTELRRIHDEALAFDWEAHLAALSMRLGLGEAHALSTTDVGLPPAWFNGDVEAIQPGRWTLVVSLNPGKPPAGYYGDDLRRDNGWDFWRRHNAGRWWYWKFFRPLVRVAATALGDVVPRDDEPLYATERMVFVELCPYASRSFALGDDAIAALSRDDPGFWAAARVRRLLIDEARPALLLVNGAPAVRDAEAVDGDRLRWATVRYESASAPRPGKQPKPLWHKQGLYAAPAGAVPAVGFPFLRKPATHNANEELDQLGLAIRRFREQAASS